MSPLTGPLAPGVYREFFAAPPAPAFRTGVPAFLGLAAAGPVAQPREVHGWAEFAAAFGGRMEDGLLAPAVHAFFATGGTVCRIVRVADGTLAALRAGLAALELDEEVDLVCAPDVMATLARARAAGGDGAAEREAAVAAQRAVLEHCTADGGRFALLDAPPGATPDEARAHRAALAGTGPHARLDRLRDGALYYPWLRVEGWPGWVPPCGHAAGTCALADRRTGVHKPPANERLQGVLDVERAVGEADHASLTGEGINVLRALPGRGVRILGARTLAGAHPAASEDGAWTHVGVRRTLLTLARWARRTLPALAFETSDPSLWTRIVREVDAWLAGLYRQGALKGATPAEAYYVRCDASLNPPAVREQGVVVVEVGLAPAAPNEFVVVRFTQAADGAETLGPAGPAQTP